MQVIECRNTQQIREDDLLKAHTEVVGLLKLTAPPFGILYSGKIRQRMCAVRIKLEQAIELGDATPPPRWSAFNTPWTLYLTHTVWC